MEFEDEKEKERYEKGQVYILLVAILNVVEFFLLASFNSGQGFFSIVPFQVIMNILLFQGHSFIYKFIKYFGFAVGGLGVFGCIYHLITPHVWTSGAVKAFIIFVFVILYSAWSMYILRKEYVSFYVETKKTLKKAH